MIIDCIGCLHGSYPQLQGGDLLIVTGDLTRSDKSHQYIDFFLWLEEQNYQRKVVISGNHDNILQIIPPNPELSSKNIYYLLDSGIEFEGLKIWGSPWSARFERMNPHCCAFTGKNDEEIAPKFALIPTDTDILITHSPPFTIRDMNDDGKHLGSHSLRKHHVERVRPKLWAFSHIHEGYGQEEGRYCSDTKYVNCSIMTKHYQATNKPIRIIL